jgi:hypothetical protein
VAAGADGAGEEAEDAKGAQDAQDAEAAELGIARPVTREKNCSAVPGTNAGRLCPPPKTRLQIKHHDEVLGMN